jgi:hypothetical protein
MDHTGPDGHDTSEHGSDPGIDGKPCTAPRQQGRTLLTVAAVGGATTVGAYALSGGSIPIFVAVMVAIGIVARVGARALTIRQGRQPPRGWWL